MSDCWDDTIGRGASWSRTVNWQDEHGDPVVLTGGVVRYVIRRGTTSLLELTSPSGVTLLPDPGQFRLSLAPTQTQALPAELLSHEVWVTLGSNVTHLVCGRLNVSDC